jgi:peptidoglycan/xylan/chitin deacetylase (PgdA/CDA1 family)
MNARMIVRFLMALAIVALPRPAALADTAPRTPRTVAFTIDDLPASRSGSLADTRRITAGLLAGFRAAGIPAIGFVNEVKLDVPGEEAARERLLADWLDAGHELGNHGYRHVRFHDTTVEAMQTDLLDGERVTRRLLAARGRAPRWFRHPTLSTGADSASRAAFEAFLAGHGYAVAPVTMDNDEWIYAAAYDKARARGDRASQQRVARDYLRYMEEVTTFHERLGRELFGREIAHTLLLHANMLNAEHVGDLAAMFRRRGYRFVSLAEAMADPAYRSPDRYIGDKGFSWLQRWAFTRGDSLADQPRAPEWVQVAMR